MSEKAVLMSQLARDHPRWKLENIEEIAQSESIMEKIRLEVLYENPCVKCRKQMGEHIYGIGLQRFICPEEK